MTSTYRRRPFLTEPGERLIVASNAWDVATRFTDMVDATGLPGDFIHTTPLVAVPLPIRTVHGDERTGRRWPSTVHPEFMWHPFMWLPDRVALRYRIASDDDPRGYTLETDAEWAVRVALEVTATGLYDTATGTWLDVLDTVGLDIDNSVDLARVEEWLNGEPDADLDRIDISDAFAADGEDEHWAFEVASGLIPQLQPASWAIMADSLIATVSNDIQANADTATIAKEARWVVGLAKGILSEVPAGEDGKSPESTWDRIDEELGAPGLSAAAIMAGPVNEFTEALYGIRDDYWSFVDQFSKVAAEQPAGAPA
ncbi:hypothetical protein [Agromyces subbeticus]|uniref:hypothetical protein n=1 Tax=Agromyces subbeticus TaxID=293890 RepID=UPI00041E44FF|nr:hypothetical protein [Agromyces subbeticus]